MNDEEKQDYLVETRDYFAGCALRALLQDDFYLTKLHRETVAEEAYLYADAMMRARDKK